MRVLAFPLVLFLGFGCGPHDAAHDTDTGSATDADADTDAGNDTDADTDTNSDSDTDEPYAVSCDAAVQETAQCTVDADGDGTYLTIQEAVDAASEGDVITVCPGVYDGVIIDRVGVTLVGYGQENTCIIGTSAPGITLDHVDVDIGGFTVSGEGTAEKAGAIHAQMATGSMHHLRVAGVGPNASGASFAVLSSWSMTWDHVVFEHNRVNYAFKNHHDAGGVVRHSIFRENRIGLASFSVIDDGELEVSNCIFSNNGTGLWVDGGRATIANNVFYHNTTGVQVHESSILYNNVSMGNWYGYSGTVVRTDYNVAWDNSHWNWPHDGSTGGGEHDVVVDPLFEDPGTGDFRLRLGSALIDGGVPDASYNDADGTRNDIGAFGGPYGAWSPP